jgi:hypothetical protein
MLLNLEGRKLVPAGWCEDESGWLYGILELAMRGPKAFDPARKVPFAFFLTRRVIGNCSSRRRRERERTEPLARLAEDAATVSGSDDLAEDEREVRALFSRLGSDEDDAGLRARVEVALEGGEPTLDEADLREIRRVMFSAR